LERSSKKKQELFMYNMMKSGEETNGKFHLPHRKLIFVVVLAIILAEVLTIPLQQYLHTVFMHALVDVLILIGITLPILYGLVLTPLVVSNNNLWELSNYDNLTKIFNRRYFLHALNHEYSRVARHGRPVSVIIFDIDNFKHINDTYGHSVGDEVLKKITKLTKNRLRGYCTLARYGGEEFVIIVPEATINEAFLVAEQIRNLVAETKVWIDPTLEVGVTISVGVAAYNQDVDATVASLINRADVALYHAKHQGKNCTVNAE